MSSFKVSGWDGDENDDREDNECAIEDYRDQSNNDDPHRDDEDLRGRKH